MIIKRHEMKEYCIYLILKLGMLFILQDLKALLSSTKTEFDYLQSQVQRDLKNLGMLLRELESMKCSGYGP